MKSFSEYLAERKDNAKRRSIAEFDKNLQSATQLSEEEKKRIIEELLSSKAYNAAAEAMLSLELSKRFAEVMEEIHNNALSRAAVAMQLNESPASERLVRGVARSVIRDHHDELERLAYK